MSILGNQYSTQQKIQRPSEDPVIAVRSLKYRTSITELEQYYKKNVPDAMSWISNTETALQSVNEILTSMNTYFNQGANDTLETTERDALVQTLTEYKEQIYQCLNADYAGRYLFTGFRTDTSLMFEETPENIQYTIKEPLSSSSLQIFTYVVGGADYSAGQNAAYYAGNAPAKNTGYRMNLAYNKLDTVDAFSYKNSAGTKVEPDIKQISVSDPNAYDIDAYNNANGTNYSALVIEETGEMIMTKDLYTELQDATDIQVQYTKSKFDKGNPKPEHYFDCTKCETTTDATGNTTVVAGTEKSYTVPSSQKIQYEVNFSQSIIVNTLANESVNFDLINQMDDIINQIQKVQDVEKKLSDIESMIKNGTYAASEKDAVLELKTQVENELTLEKSVLQEKFGNGLTTTTNTQASVNKVVADLGSRYKRLELTEARLSDQLTTFNEMLTKNDKVDIEDAVVNYTSALTAYNASLNATAKIAQNSLLDFL